MGKLIFYSWQSDLPNKTNRYFILDSLKKAVSDLNTDNIIQEAIRVEHDTTGEPGSPDIGQVIIDRIEKADIFVCDLSIINGNISKEHLQYVLSKSVTGKDDNSILFSHPEYIDELVKQNRLTPNPNVIFELGYALNQLGYERIIMIINSAFGSLDQLPFDLKTKRIHQYNLSIDAKNRNQVKTDLINFFKEALGYVLQNISEHEQFSDEGNYSLYDLVLEKIRNNSADQGSYIRKYITDFINTCEKLIQDDAINNSAQQEDPLLRIIPKTKLFYLQYINITRTIAELNSTVGANELYNNFGKIIEKYTQSFIDSGSTVTSEGLFKFVGNELFVTFIAFLIKENRWELMGSLLDKHIFIENNLNREAEFVNFGYISQYIRLVYPNSEYQRKSINQSSLLKERHSEHDIDNALSFKDYMSADYFLWLREHFRHSSTTRETWHPWTTVYINYIPRFIKEAINTEFAKQLVTPIGASNIEDLRTRIIPISQQLEGFFRNNRLYSHPLSNFDALKIASIE